MRPATVLALLAVLPAVPARASQEEIDELNARIRAEHLQWVAGETPITRLPKAERSRYWMKGGVPPWASLLCRDPLLRPSPAPTFPAMDWRNKDGFNWITPIRDQGSCGACWAFATIATVEALVAYRTSTPDPTMDLSEQQLLDCAGASFGCDSGGITWGMPGSYLKNTGAVSESCYPYTQAQGSCQTSGLPGSCTKTRVDGLTELMSTFPPNPFDPTPDFTMSASTMDDIKNYLIERPVGSSMVVYSDLGGYTSGIYQPTAGATKEGMHAVLIVGYDDAGGYWIIKNSWDPTWGEQGYFRIRYNTSSLGVWSFVYQYGEAQKAPAFCTTGPNALPARIVLDSQGNGGDLVLANCAGGVLSWTASFTNPALRMVDGAGALSNTGNEVAAPKAYRVTGVNLTPGLRGAVNLTSSNATNGPISIAFEVMGVDAGVPPGPDAAAPGPDAAPAGPDAAPPAGPDADTIPPDAGFVLDPPDADSQQPVIAHDASQQSTTQPSDEGSGCGCGAMAGAPMLAGASLALALLRRRKRSG